MFVLLQLFITVTAWDGSVEKSSRRILEVPDRFSSCKLLAFVLDPDNRFVRGWPHLSSLHPGGLCSLTLSYTQTLWGGDLKLSNLFILGFHVFPSLTFTSLQWGIWHAVEAPEW